MLSVSVCPRGTLSCSPSRSMTAPASCSAIAKFASFCPGKREFQNELRTADEVCCCMIVMKSRDATNRASGNRSRNCVHAKEMIAVAVCRVNRSQVTGNRAVGHVHSRQRQSFVCVGFARTLSADVIRPSISSSHQHAARLHRHSTQFSSCSHHALISERFKSPRLTFVCHRCREKPIGGTKCQGRAQLLTPSCTCD